MLPRMKPRFPFLAVIGPGLLVAATGVGAGDLATAGFAGSRLGLGVAWAVLVGAAMKFVITEGLARWQLATGTSLLEGVASRIGRPAMVVFLAYFLLWSFFVCGSLIKACSVTLQALLPSLEVGPTGGAMLGLAHSLAGLGLVLLGGFKLFSRVMAVAIGLMVVSVVVAAIATGPDLAHLLRGLLVPTIPEPKTESAASPTTWVVALIGGVGGTVTVLCYGYWLRETKRDTKEHMRSARIDLAVGYAVTALFGVSMIVIASGVGPVDGKGTGLLAQLAVQLSASLGAWAGTLFLVGAWAAIFSSLLGVWQSVPYLFADTLRLLRRTPTVSRPLTQTRSYKAYLVAIATVPMLGMAFSFEQVQLLYTVCGAMFVPMLAAALLYLNNQRSHMGNRRTSWLGNAALIGTLAFFAWVGFNAAASTLPRILGR